MRRPLSMVCLIFICAMIVFTSIVPISYQELEQWEKEQITVTGQVLSKEKKIKDGQTTFLLYLNHIKEINPMSTSEMNIEGILCYLTADSFVPPIGSYVSVSGKVSLFSSPTNPGEFDLRQYRKIQKLDFAITGATVEAVSKEENVILEQLYGLREKIALQIDVCFGGSYAGIVKTIMLGDKSELDGETKSLYQRNGMIHILCISGLHISILGMGLYRLLRGLGLWQWVSTVICIILVILYGLMTGMGTSAFRAIFMFSMHLLALWIGRTYDVLTAMCVAAVLLLIEQPLYVYHSGFLLSFASVTAITGCTPLFTEGMKVKEKVATGLAIYVVTLPVYGLFYYEIPVYSMLLNLLLLPLVTVVLALAIAACVVGALWSSAGMVIAFFDKLLFALFELVFNMTEKLPCHTLILGHTDRIRCVIFYIALALLVWFAGKIKPLYRMVAVVILCFFLFVRWQSGLTVTVLDVGQGDSTFISHKGGHGILIDCGSTDQSQVGKYSLIPFLKYAGVHTIDAIFISHLDADHVGGIEELLSLQSGKDFQIGRIFLAAGAPKDEAYEKLITLANDRQVPVLSMVPGDSYQSGNVKFTCLQPAGSEGDRNALSLVLQMDYGGFNGLFMGDTDSEGEARVMQYLQQQGQVNLYQNNLEMKTTYEYIKVGHHGSATSSSEQFLDFVQPVFVTISSGEENRYGHPSEQTLKRLYDKNIPYLRTDEYGAITIRTDGEKIWLEGFRKN